MNHQKSLFPQLDILRHLAKWMLLMIPVAISIGSMVALFLWLLDKATILRWQNPWLLWLLPLVGISIMQLYRLYGKESEAGNNLVLDEIHQPGGGLPVMMAPLVLVSTVITHLFGGSAGREGTAIQMGGGISSLFSKWYRLSNDDKRILLMGGVAAGFGAVFGTPVAGAIFALEILTIGRVKYHALLPCLMASLLADITCTTWGIHHTHYSIMYQTVKHNLLPYLHFDMLLLARVIAAGVAFGLVSYLFTQAMHTLKNTLNKYVPYSWLIPVLGGCIIILLTYILGTTDYLGLGVTSPNGGVSIVSAFHADGATYFSWFWKLLFTVITLSTGFKGGEVTPLFFIGATLGNTLAVISGAPVDLFAGIGFIAVFAGATNTPLACTIMGVELFGGEHIIYYAVACFTAYYFSGHTGIYSAQKNTVSKISNEVIDDI